MFNLSENIQKWWSLNETLPEKIDAIVCVSYGATKDSLTITSSSTAILAKDIAQKHPEAKFFWGSFHKSSHENIEKELKEKLFAGLNATYIGGVTSTTDECDAVRELCKEPSVIVVVSEGSHSRRCKAVWKYFYPKSKVLFRSVLPADADDSKNPMIFQKWWPVWLIVNIILYPLYWGNGPRRMEKINLSQPSI